ncbi:MAG: MmgE/PrpD family protein [bacterium]|nr:MmgE/PrpD family protein [bacterium]
MSVAEQLAARITATRYEDLTPEAVYWSKVAVLDTLGVTLAGATEDAPRILYDVLELGQTRGPSLMLGTARRLGCLDAALVNGVSSHTLDFDNTSNTMAGHMSATMIPALIAAGEAYGASGKDVLLAHAVGFETGARFGHGLNFHHHEKGWHPTSTLGVFAVTAACARMLSLSAEQTANALGLSTSLAAGTKANFGTMTKPLHAGQCARSGLMSALLSRKGFTANPNAFEHKQGFFNVFNGPGNFDAGRILESWGKPLDVTAPGAAYKQYACCAGAHAAIEAALMLVAKHGVFDPRSLERVNAWTPARRLAHTDRPQPNSALDAKFSVQYCVVRALLDGKVVFEHFEGDAYREERVCGLLPRVHAAPHKPGQFAPDNNNGAVVEVMLTDGSVHSAKVERALGRTAQNPIPIDQLRAKFENCASRVLGPKAVSAALRATDRFEEVASIKDFTALLETAA